MSAGLSCTRWHRSRWQRIREPVCAVACYLIVFGPIAVYAGACLADWLVTP